MICYSAKNLMLIINYVYFVTSSIQCQYVMSFNVFVLTPHISPCFRNHNIFIILDILMFILHVYTKIFILCNSASSVHNPIIRYGLSDHARNGASFRNTECGCRCAGHIPFSLKEQHISDFNSTSSVEI